MANPNIVDLSTTTGSRLIAAKFDPIGSSLLDLTGLTPSGRVARLGTLIIGFEGALTPVWSTVTAQLLTDWARGVLLAEIASRLTRRQREQVS